MHRRAITHLKRSDPTLAAIIAQVGPYRLRRRDEDTHFHALVRAIVYQQLSGKAAATIHGRILALYEGTPTPAHLLSTDDETLRAAGLSRQKLTYLKDLARHVESGELPLDRVDEMKDEEIIDALTKVKGIGVWTAQMFLMFRLERPNVLPVLDLGIRKAIQLAYRMRAMPKEKHIRRIAEPWAPYASVACWYLWRSLELPSVIAARRASTSAARRPRPGSKRPARAATRTRPKRSTRARAAATRARRA